MSSVLKVSTDIRPESAGDLIILADSTGTALVTIDSSTSITTMNGLKSNGSVVAKRVAVASNAFPYTTTATDYLVAATSLTGASAITLSAGVAGRSWIFKDESGTCSVVNTITITPASGTIDGAATYVLLSAYASVRIYTDGTSFYTQ